MEAPPFYFLFLGGRGGGGGTQTALDKNGRLSSMSNAVMLEKDIFGCSHM